MKNRDWKTTAAGILGIVSALALAGKALLDGDPLTNPDWGSTWTTIIMAIGLIKAADSSGGPPKL